MGKEIPYYNIDDNGETHYINSNGEVYIDDADLKELLIELLGDEVSHDEIQKILDAASDENITDDDFDRLVDEFIINNKSLKY